MIDEIELTQYFIEYAKTNQRLAELRKLIEGAVLDIGETRKIAGVTATYYKPSHETPDYEGAARRVMPLNFDLTPFSTTTVTVSWKSVCESLFATPEEGAEKPARVVVK